MSDPTLEPCPFCGSRCFFNHEDANNSRGEEYVRVWVECTGCDMRSITKRVVYGMPDTKVMLAGLWNRRVATPPADAALAESEGDTDLQFEHYDCKVCGRHMALDYDEMK